MKLDFIDISRDDEYEPGSAARSSDRRVTSKSEEKINRSVFLDVNEAQNVNKKVQVREIRNIDVSRDVNERRKTSDRGGTERRPAGREERRAPNKRRSPENSRARQEREKRRKRRRRKQLAAKITVLLFMISMIGLLLFVLVKLTDDRKESVGAVSKIENRFTSSSQRKEIVKVNKSQKPVIEENFLTVNEYSRPGDKLETVNNIFVHYTANRGTSAAQNRSYFENLGITGETSASAHFIIGFDGEIIQCIPLEEIAYAVQKRNYDSISIECCYLQDNGKFTEATYQSLIHLCAWLLNEYQLAPDDMRRHYDEGGKKCPLYYVEHEDAWEQFLKDLKDYIMTGKLEDA